MAAERSAEWHRWKSTCRTHLPESVCGLHRHTSKASVSCTPRQLGPQPHALPSSVLYELASKRPYLSLCSVCIQVDQQRWHSASPLEPCSPLFCASSCACSNTSRGVAEHKQSLWETWQA